MQDIKSQDLKTILHSARANIYYLERCRVLVNGGRVEYVTDAGKRSLYWNIPIANTTSILLGTGTSITQAAMRELAKAGVGGLCGGGGTPLFSANEVDVEVAWLTRKVNTAPPNICKLGCSSGLMMNSGWRQPSSCKACAWIGCTKNGIPVLREAGFVVDTARLQALVTQFKALVAQAPDVTALLTDEARLTKALFKLAVDATGYGDFTRAKRGSGTDSANRFLDHGNYLGYGLGATATWVLGLPHGLAVLHGKTRRGGLVFDAADLVKDAAILPQAFLSAMRGDDEQAFRRNCIETLTRGESLDFIIDSLKAIATDTARMARQTSARKDGLA